MTRGFCIRQGGRALRRRLPEGEGIVVPGLIGLMLLGTALLGAVASTASAQEPASPTTPLQTSFHLSVEVAPTSVTVEGTLRLVYELHLTNFAREPLTVRQVEVLDGETGTQVADLRDEALADRLAGPGMPPGNGDRSRSIGPGMHAVLYLEIPVEADALPRTLEHRVSYHVTGEDPKPGAATRGASVRVDTARRATLAPPLRGGPWAALYHPCWERGHRRVLYAIDGRARIPGRFAIDWMKMNPDGLLTRGDRDRVENWYGYGAEVLAVADGVVEATRVHLRESATLSDRPRTSLDESDGNFIVLNLEDGRYAFYGHLQPGSVRVQVGDRVRRGEVIGAVGFTGSAGGPQLHFHLADGPSSLGAEGLPFEIDGFEVMGSLGSGHEGADCADAARALEGLGQRPWTPWGTTMDPRRTGEFPAPNVVIDFGQGG